MPCGTRGALPVRMSVSSAQIGTALSGAPSVLCTILHHSFAAALSLACASGALCASLPGTIDLATDAAMLVGAAPILAEIR